MLPFLPQPLASITLVNNLKDSAPRDLLELELIAEHSPPSLSPKASLALMEVSAAAVVVEVAGEAVVEVVETSEDKTTASEDVEVPEGAEEDLVAKVAPQLRETKY